jgi:hypothetical protein
MKLFPFAKRHIGSIPFMLMWTVGHIVPWGAYYFFEDNTGIPLMLLVTLIAMIIGSGIGFAQKMLLRYAYDLPMNGWVRLTTLGWVGGWAAYFGLAQWIPHFYSYPLGILLIPMFIFPAVLQWFLLRQHVKGAWVWMVAAAVSAVTFGFAYESGTFGLTEIILSASAQASVTGLSLLWLFGMTHTLPPLVERDFSRLAMPDEEQTCEEFYNYHTDKKSYLIQG